LGGLVSEIGLLINLNPLGKKFWMGWEKSTGKIPVWQSSDKLPLMCSKYPCFWKVGKNIEIRERLNV
jgi:hypothetical protein